MKLYVFGEDGTFEKVENGGKPAGVLLTMPKAFFEHYPGGEERMLEWFKQMNKHDGLWWNQTIANVPTLDVEFAYLVYGGKVQYRLTIDKYERNVTKEFTDKGTTRIFEKRNWAILTGPVEKADKDYWMRGFQGFRYTDFIF